MTTIDQVIAEKIGSWYVGEWPLGNLCLCVIALILSAILCGAIGLERERKGRAAGLRTHLLVGLGSCIIMIISIYGLPNISVNGQTLNRDVARLAAQVITGVGFLGAGAIIHKRDGIRGLTTAATIWMVMAIGLACGSMNFVLAIGGTVIILVCLTVFKKFELRITKRSPMFILHCEVGKPVISRIIEAAKAYKSEVEEINFELDDAGDLEFVFHVVSNNEAFSTTEFISIVEKIDGVKDIDLLNNHKL